MYPIASTTVGAGGAGSIIFSSIPQNFTHLQVRMNVRSAYAGLIAGGFFRLNNDSGGNYTYHYLAGAGGSASSGGATSSSVAYVGDLVAATSTSSVFSNVVLDILDYTNVNKYKTTRALSGYDANGSGNVFLASSLWLNTNAITQIEILGGGGGALAQYTTIQLYGISTSTVTGA
jgi:hypothetical protein